MISYRVFNLRLWLPLIVLIIFSILLFSMVFYLHHTFNKKMIERSLGQVKSEMSWLQRQIEEELYEKRYKAASQALAVMDVNPEISILIAMDENGKIVFSTRNALKGKLAREVVPGFNVVRFMRLKQTQKMEILFDDSQDIITAYYPLVFANHPSSLRLYKVGVLYAVYDMNYANAILWQEFINSSLIIWLLSLLGMLILLGILIVFINRPLFHLVNINKQLAEGNLGIQNRIIGDGELMQLGKSFNEMSLRLQENQNTLINIAKGISSASGGSFFNLIALHLAEALQADYAIIGETIPNNPDRIRTIAVVTFGYFTTNFEYDLVNTPCEKTISQSICSFPHSVQMKFPMDNFLKENNVEAYVGTRLFDSFGNTFGVMKALFLRPIKNTVYSENILKIFATRTSIELERERMVLELQKNENIIHNAQRIANLGFWDWNFNKNEFFWSEEVYKIFGLDSKKIKITNETFLDFVHPEDKEFVIEKISSALKNLKPYKLDYRIILPNNLIRYVHEQGEIERKFNGKPIRMIGTLLDITERKKIEQELAMHRDKLESIVNERTMELQKTQGELLKKSRLATLGQLTATVSHELRNPLSAIAPSLYVIKRQIDKNNPMINKALDRIERNIKRCDSIIDEMLDFTRITSLDTQSQRLDDWLTAILDEQDIPKEIKLTRSLGLSGLNLPFDADRLSRAIINILDNACHAMQVENNPNRIIEGATLDVATRQTNERIEIIITDNGSGIPKDIIDKVFEPLFSTKSFGVGLGMPTVKHIMEQHGGGIEIDSKPANGTRITLWLLLPEQKGVVASKTTLPVIKG